LDDFDPYAELQLSPDAEPELIKAAFKALAKKYHPDKFTDPHEKRRAEEKMARINEAQQLLASGNYRPPARREVEAAVPPPSPPPVAAARPKPATPPRPRPTNIRKGPFVAAALAFVALLMLPSLISGNNLQKALNYEDEGRFQDALIYLNKAVADDPHDRELYRHRARIWEKLGEPEKAAVDLQNARVPTLSLPTASATPKVPDASAQNSDSHVP
jgi:curved DNA-binding protein CbpA